MRGKLHLEDWISAKLKWLRHSPSVMPGLDLGTHLSSQERSRCWRWIAGSSPVKPGNDGCVSPRRMRRYREPFSVQLRGQFSRVSQRLHRSLLKRGIQEDQCISGRNNILQEAATDAARAKLRRFANRAFRSGLLSRTVEMTAEPGPRRLARAERQRLLHLIPFYRDHRRVSSKLIALRCLHRGHFPQCGLPSVSERHRYAYGPGKRYDHTLWRSNPVEGTHLSP